MTHLWSEEAKIAYAAGILDGEGTIGIPRQGKRGFRLYIQIGLNHKGWGVLDFLKENFNGKLYTPFQPKGNRSIQRTCAWSGNSAATFLEKVFPYLIIKKAQAELGLSFQRMMDNKGRGWTQFFLEKGEEYHLKMKEFNSKGKIAFVAKEPKRLIDLFSDLDD